MTSQNNITFPLSGPQPCLTCDRDKREVAFCPWCGHGGAEWKKEAEDEQ